VFYVRDPTGADLIAPVRWQAANRKTWQTMLAQIEGGAEVVKTAISHSWEAGAVAVILLACLGSIGYLMRALWLINQRLADRVTHLEEEFANKLLMMVEVTTRSVEANTTMLDRATRAMDKLEEAVERLMLTQQAMLARLEASPCVMVGVLSDETKRKLQEAREAAERRVQGVAKGS
jgi:hypothetical protein